ncbi:MAG: hypothetical protein SXV54_16945 [Chloroflexota bacterium]|nr:hypothetical protein [Chloroflexota bacterium]
MTFQNLFGSIVYRIVTYILIVTMTGTSSIPIIQQLPRATAAYLGMMQQLGLLEPDLLQAILTTTGMAQYQSLTADS